VDPVGAGPPVGTPAGIGGGPLTGGGPVGAGRSHPDELGGGGSDTGSGYRPRNRRAVRGQPTIRSPKRSIDIGGWSGRPQRWYVPVSSVEPAEISVM